MAKLHNEYINHSPYKLGQFGDQLENMTAQEVFNIAVEHLLLQNKKSGGISKEFDEFDCLYNGNGVCCVAAPFIKDYNKEMEQSSWIEITTVHQHSNLILELQSIHDSFEPEQWAELLIDLAFREELEKPQILIDKLNAK